MWKATTPSISWWTGTRLECLKTMKGSVHEFLLECAMLSVPTGCRSEDVSVYLVDIVTSCRQPTNIFINILSQCIPTHRKSRAKGWTVGSMNSTVVTLESSDWRKRQEKLPDCATVVVNTTNCLVLYPLRNDFANCALSCCRTSVPLKSEACYVHFIVQNCYIQNFGCSRAALCSSISRK